MSETKDNNSSEQVELVEETQQDVVEESPPQQEVVATVISEDFLAGGDNSESQEKIQEESQGKSATKRKHGRPRKYLLSKLRLPDAIANFVIEAETSSDEPISDEEYTLCLNVLSTTKGRRKQVTEICEILDIERPKKRNRKAEQKWLTQVCKNAGLKTLLDDDKPTFDEYNQVFEMIDQLL